jgi:hypothetical protein
MPPEGHKAPASYYHALDAHPEGARGEAPPQCQACGCTEEDCSQCIERTGEPCSWVAPGLCSACLFIAEQATMAMDHLISFSMGLTDQLPPPGALQQFSIEELLGAGNILTHYCMSTQEENAERLAVPKVIPVHQIIALFTLAQYSSMPADRNSAVIAKDGDFKLVVVRADAGPRIWRPGDPL